MPAPVSTNEPPFKSAGPLTTEKVTGNPEDAEASNAKGPLPNTRFSSSPNCRVCTAGSTTSVRSTVCAASKFTEPVCIARSTTTPPPLRVTIPSFITAGPLKTDSATSSPELAVAVTLKGASPYVLRSGTSKLMDCPPLPTTNERSTLCAGEYSKEPS